MLEHVVKWEGWLDVLCLQGWSLDNCMDEKSKATIEKMLLEEQYPFVNLLSQSSVDWQDITTEHTVNSHVYCSTCLYVLELQYYKPEIWGSFSNN